MSTRVQETPRSRGALGAPLVAFVLASFFAGEAFGQQPDPAKSDCTCSGKTIDIVDYSKPANEVEGQNKVRIGVLPAIDSKTNALTVDVQGSAYYPDGVVLFLSVRHWKVVEPFAKAKVTVKNNTFSHKFGPFTKPVPRGGLAVEAWFVRTTQTAAIQNQLVTQKYFRSTPPCRHDERNRTTTMFSLGGVEEEQQSEKEEKDQIAQARQTMLDAYKVADLVLLEVEQKKQAPEAAQAAYAKLEQDLASAANKVTDWTKGRQCLLFANRFQQVRSLSSYLRDWAKGRAVAVGVAIQGLTADTAKTLVAAGKKEATKASDELKGFLDETDSLDKAWDAAGQEVKKDTAKDGAAPAAPAGGK